MLVRFTVENCLSFRDRVELSMIAAEEVLDHPEHVIRAGGEKSVPVLKLGVIYGANASGKSNLVKAMLMARGLILNPPGPNERIARTPFKLDPACRDKPTRYEFEIKLDDRYFAYGFSVSSARVEEEWLFEVGRNVEDRIFERTGNRFEWGRLEFSNPDERAFLEFTAKGTLPNRLFLSECRERNVPDNVPGAEDLVKATRWFEDGLIVALPDRISQNLAFRVRSDESFRQQLTGYLRCSDAGVENEESNGTRRLMQLVPATIAIMRGEGVFVIDEFDRSLHPNVLHSYLANFLKHSAGRSSQLIVTTHDTTLLRQHFLRRDEVWFVEKGNDQASRLIALEEFKNVDQSKDLQKDYLLGRFGGVPVILDFTWLAEDRGERA